MATAPRGPLAFARANYVKRLASLICVGMPGGRRGEGRRIAFSQCPTNLPPAARATAIGRFEGRYAIGGLPFDRNNSGRSAPPIVPDAHFRVSRTIAYFQTAAVATQELCLPQLRFQVPVRVKRLGRRRSFFRCSR